MTSKHPKPISRYSLGERKHTPRKAVIYAQVWAVGCWTYHNEEKIRFKTLGEARTWASKHGFDGIHVDLNGDR